MKVIATRHFYDNENRVKRTKGDEFSVSPTFYKGNMRFMAEVKEEPVKKRSKKSYKTKEEKLTINDKSKAKKS